MEDYHWHCNDFIQHEENSIPSIQLDAMIIINCQLPLHFHRFWKKDSNQKIICADGGANRLFDYWEEMDQVQLREKFIPSIICGDFDSISSQVSSYYSSHGSEMRPSSCQETTDLEKCLKLASDCKSILIVGAFGGNVTQELSNMNVLYTHPQKILLYGRDNLIFRLSAQNSHFIHCKEGTKVGLIPLGMPVESVESKGLKWEIEGRKLEFGGLISSSNEISSSPVFIKSSHHVIFSVDFRK